MKHILCLFLLGSSSLLLAQSTTDSRSWIGIETAVELSRLIDIDLGIQHRTKDNLAALDEYFFENTINYKLNDQFNFGIGTRYIKHNDTKGGQQGIENRWRFQAELSFKQKWERLIFKSKLQYQTLRDAENAMDVLTNYIRLKNSVEFKINHWKYDPTLSVEPFVYSNHPFLSGIKQWRFGIDTDFNVFNDQKIKVGYYYATNVQDTFNRHIFILLYKLKL